MRRVRSPCSLEERAQGPIMASHTVRRKLERPVRPPITSEPCLSHTTATKNNGRKRRRENPLTKPDQNGGSTEDGMAAAFAKFGYISRLVYPSRGAPAEYVVVFFFLPFLRWIRADNFRKGSLLHIQPKYTAFSKVNSFAVFRFSKGISISWISPIWPYLGARFSKNCITT